VYGSAAPSLEPEDELRPSSRLGPYVLLGEWARGGMGILWAARHIETGHVVAVKTLLPHVAAENQFRFSFLDEASLASRIEHPNVAVVYGAGEDRGHLYCVMELIRGDSLRVVQRDAEARKRVLAPGIVAMIVAKACAGLHAAHELKGPDGKLLGVVHRDISPHNILLGTGGTVKLIDFGIAKAKDRLAADTSTGLIKGKVDYMAPEQVQTTRALDRRTDVYCMGATLYSMLAGKPPYESAESGQMAALSKLIEGAPIRALPSNIPRLLSDVAFRALERDPAKRFPSADAMRLALEDAIARLGLVLDQAALVQFAESLLGDRMRTREYRVFAGGGEPDKLGADPRAATNIANQSQVRLRSDQSQTRAFFAGVLGAIACGGLLVTLGLQSSGTRTSSVVRTPIRAPRAFRVAPTPTTAPAPNLTSGIPVPSALPPKPTPVVQGAAKVKAPIVDQDGL
jgi:eukaryotic-like serine/threonine-protein kinase